MHRINAFGRFRKNGALEDEVLEGDDIGAWKKDPTIHKSGVRAGQDGCVVDVEDPLGIGNSRSITDESDVMGKAILKLKRDGRIRRDIARDVNGDGRIARQVEADFFARMPRGPIPDGIALGDISRAGRVEEAVEADASF
jgi:hypothetical protein